MKDKSSNYKNCVVESVEYRERNERLRTRKIPKITTYPWAVNEKIEFRIPPTILEAMSKVGWSAFGVYEVIKEEIAHYNKDKKKYKISNEEANYETKFHKIVQMLIDGQIDYKINFCTHPELDGTWSAYLMGEGSEQ